MKRFALYCMLAAYCLLLYGPGLLTLPPVDRDEARFAQATRQMVESKDFLDIRLGETERHKKPVGIHWLQAATLQMVQVSQDNARGRIWPYRVPSLVGATAAVLLTFAFGILLFEERVALLGAALLATSPLLVMEAHLATTDAALLAAVVASQGALALLYVRSFEDATSRAGERTEGLAGAAPFSAAQTGLVILFWAALAVGVLLKGPLILLSAGLTAGVLAVADRSTHWLRPLRPVIGVTMLAGILLPWFVLRSPSAAFRFIVDSLGSDVLPKLVSGQESHGFPPGYHLLLVPLLFWPGFLMARKGLLNAWKDRTSASQRFCLAWIGSLWLFFELVPTKLPHYVLPVYPALALLTARSILHPVQNRLASDRWMRLESAVSMVVGLLLAAAVLLLPTLFGVPLDGWILFCAASLGCATVMARYCADRGRWLQATGVAMLGCALFLTPLLHSILPRLDGLWLSRSVSVAVDRHTREAKSLPDVIVAGQYEEPSLFFLLPKRVVFAEVEEAARHLAEDRTTLTVIDGGFDEAFRQAAARLDVPLRLIDTLRGFHYTKGRWMTLRLYAHENSL